MKVSNEIKSIKKIKTIRNSRIFTPVKLLAAIIFCWPSFAFADDYYTAHEQGWHWYQDPPPEKTDAQKNQGSAPDPAAQINTLKTILKTALDRAILNPTPENVRTYMVLQSAWIQKASDFSRVWQMVLVQHPELDYSLKVPTNQTARQVYIDQQQQKELAAVHQLASHSGLFFFYKSTCPYCQRFAPILKDFSEKYGITIVPITTDGVALPEFPNSRIDHGQAEKFHVTMEPALFAVDPYTHQATPVSYGLLTEDELKTRIYDIATNFKGDGA